MDGQIKVAIDGTGGMGRIHAMAFLSDPRCKLVGFCSRNEDQLGRIASGSLPEVGYGDSLQKEVKIDPPPKSWKTVEALAQDREVHAVSICLPNSLHYAHAKVLIESGKHLLIEKPMAINSYQCQMLTELAEKHNVLLQIAHMWRFHAEVLALKKIIDEGLIGEIVQIKGYSIHERWSPAFFGPSTWFINKDLSGGGALIDMGVHAIDTINFLLGDPGCESVYARIRTAYHENIEVDDCDMLICNYKNGAVGFVESAWNSPYAEGSESCVVIFGTKGYARLFPTEAGYYKEDGWKVDRLFEKSGSDIETRNSYYKQAESFIDSITGGKTKTLVPGEAGTEAVKICDAAYLSEKTKQVVYLNSLDLKGNRK